ncbi:MAG: ferrous iron transport protein A [Treponema sp.]|jgi:ferrous iron transport protein A|nr:ferrous iron transport protein A [Treponema sp.]
MPISLANNGETGAIKRIGGSEDMKKRLESLGFTVGSAVTVVSKLGENVIVNVKDSRVALSRDLARRIFV